ncbi:uncharacterized protein JCM15063_006013 [Sporobolomyces koalae]|uniref:uncharacterized protein n=1 Tax=Sporobolomyces koalae TaxID=500713 RepID=UPI003174B3D9
MSPSTEMKAVSKAGINESRYARDRRELITLMDRMRSAGVATEIDLPRIAIAGNQSAGKSSLVEAISGIKVPRDSGTCTRCPFEVRLQHSDDAWSCKISLRFETDVNGKALAHIREIPFGEVIRNPDQVEPALKRAQLAVLNPSASSQKFATATNKDVKHAKEGHLLFGSSKQLSFSTNLVCIDIRGPEVTDLAFLDLPGIISNVDEGEDEANIDLIRNLVTKTVTGNALILLIFSMRDDIENQSAGRLAREADPEGKRTIGVLTKADTVQEGEHGRWLHILQGERAKLMNGYFATKLPGAADLGKDLSFEATRAQEAAFFNSTAPWSSLPTEVHNRLGIPRLTAFLSDKLSAYIKTKLPEIRSVVNEGARLTKDKIEGLPAPPSTDPLSELIGLLQSFKIDLDAYVAGAPGSEELIKGKNRIQADFACAINRTRPQFVPCSPENDSKESVSVCTSNMNNLVEEFGTENVLIMNLDDVVDRINSLKTRETPLNIPYSVKSSLMVDSTKAWSGIALDALEELQGPVSEVINKLVDRYFGRYLESGLTSVIQEITETVSAKLFATCTDRVKYLIALESTPFTLNAPYYETTLEKVRADLVGTRRNLAQAATQECIIENSQAQVQRRAAKEANEKDALAAVARHLGYNIEADDLSKLHPPDKFADAIDVMAHVQANWTRIIDNVPRFVDYDILQRLPLALSTAFTAQIISGGAEGAAHYLRESQEVQELRDQLNTKLNKISEAKKLLAAYGRF